MSDEAELQQIRAAARVIRNGGVVAYPTESCFGLGCDPGDSAAVQRILTMKNRPASMGLILIAGEYDHLSPWLAELPEVVVERMQASWPGPVSWLCPKSDQASQLISGDHPTLAVRVTGHLSAAQLCCEAGMAIVSTSANKTGSPALRTAEEVVSVFGDELDAVVSLPVGVDSNPSRIIDALSGERLR